MSEKLKGEMPPQERKESSVGEIKVEIDPTMTETILSGVKKEGYSPEEVCFRAGFTTEQYSEDEPESHKPFFIMEFKVGDQWYIASWDQQMHGGTKLLIQEK